MRSLLLLGLTAASLWGQETPIDCNQPADVTLRPETPQVTLTFQATANEVVYFRFLGTGPESTLGILVPEVRDQFGNLGIAQIRSRVPTVAGATPLDLAAQGFEVDFFADSLFRLRLRGTNSAGTGSLHVVMVRVTRPCGTPLPLTCGRPSGGSISGGTASAPPVLPGQIDTYQFNAQTGDVLTIRMLRTASSGFIDTRVPFILAVYGPDGHVINVDPKTNRLSFKTITGIYDQVDLTIVTAGTITMLVYEANGVIGGNYSLSVTRLNGGCGGPALSCGAVQDSKITTPLGIGFYTLQATQGDVWQFRTARADNFGTFTPSLEVYDAQGIRVGTAGPAAMTGHASASASLTIPATGNYSVLVGGPLDGSTGGYSIATNRLNKPCAESALGCASIVDGSIEGMLRSRIYSLAASAGDTYLIRLLQTNPASLFRPRVDIYDATGGQVGTVNTSDLQRLNFTAASDGTYSVVVTDSFDSSQSGSYTLSMLRLNRPCDPATLNCGVPAAGNLARTLSSGVYTYGAAAGESFSVRMLPTGAVLPAIEIYDALGNRTGQAVTGPLAGVDVVKPAGGSYTIVAQDNNRNPGTGSFTLDLLRTRNACGQPVPQGKTISGVVSAAAPFVSYTIEASADDVVALRSASSTAGFAAQMEIFDPEGSRLDAGVFGLSRKAPATGVYTVIVGASAARTAGGYALVWQSLNKPVGAIPLACGGTTGGALAGASQFRYYTVSADAGDTIRMIFTKTSDNFAPQVEVFDPAGARLTGNSDVTQKVSAGGNYLVVVSPSTTAFETGSYTMAYQRPNNPCAPSALICGQTTLRQVNLPGQLDTLTFNGTGGDLTTIRFASRSGNYSPFVEMYNPAGTRLTTSSNGLINRFRLPADGGYTLLVRDSIGPNLGSYRVSVQDDTNNCPVTDSESPAITLMRPTGGEVLPGGTVFHIQWLSDDNVGVTSHDIAISTDSGKTFATQVVGGLGGNQQVYDWQVPADVTPSRTAVIRVTATDAAGNTQSAASDLVTLIGSGFTPNATATYTYDGLNRLTQVAMGDGRTVQYTWDAAGNLVQITVTGQ